MSSVPDSASPAPRSPKRAVGLSTRLLFLTIGFVLLAEVMIYVPSIANFRNNWLQDRLAAARTAALVLEAAPDEALPEQLVRNVLDSIGATSIALRIKGTRRLVAADQSPPMVVRRYDLRQPDPIGSIAESFDTLLSRGSRMVAVRGPAAMDGEFVEIVLDEAPLREAMLGFSVNILLLSMFISGVTALLVFTALRALIVRPVERLTGNIRAFAERPEDITRKITPTGRSDEIGEAELALARMQDQLATQLKQKERLAALGLAVSKINHDLRNMLAAAQLFSDRLATLQDPTARTFAPKLIQTLDRAIAFCQGTLAYGKAQERQPDVRPLKLKPLGDDVRETLGIDADARDGIRWIDEVPPDLCVHADAEHLFRALLNLAKNAKEALDTHGASTAERPFIRLTGSHAGASTVIELVDNGPGLPAGLKDTLFEPFHNSGRSGGTGLGLSIAAELIRAHGGDIRARPCPAGAHFVISLPNVKGA